MNKSNMYDQITDSVIAALESGTVPWHRPWAVSGLRGMARSASTGKIYNGINAFILSLSGYTSPWWLTFKQSQKLGGNVKGQKSTQVIFWRFIDDRSKDAKRGSKIPLLRSFRVFNAEQCNLPEDALAKLESRLDKIAPPVKTTKNEVVAEAQRISDEYIGTSGVKLVHGSDQACYSPREDRIAMPDLDQFDTGEAYHHTLFHEEIHSTGHESRLDRLTKRAAFGSGEYSREELVAEMGAAFLCAASGIDQPDIDENRDAYIAGWLKRLREDNKAVVVAAGKAAKAADLILAGQMSEGDTEYDG